LWKSHFKEVRVWILGVLIACAGVGLAQTTSGDLIAGELTSAIGPSSHEVSAGSSNDTVPHLATDEVGNVMAIWFRASCAGSTPHVNIA